MIKPNELQGWIILSSDAMCNLTGTFKMWILYDLYTFSVLSCIHYILSLASYIFIRPLIRLHIFVPSTYYVFQVIIIYMNMFQNYVQNPSEYNNNRVAATLAPPLVHIIHAMYIVHRYIVYEYAMAIYVPQDSLPIYRFDTITMQYNVREHTPCKGVIQ